VISGTPIGITSRREFTFTVEASNGADRRDTKEFTLVIDAPPMITTASLPAGTYGTSYNFALQATGNTPITWAVTIGSLPPGLTLSSAGVISGTPTASGTFNFTIQARNNSSIAGLTMQHHRQFTIVIHRAVGGTVSGATNLHSIGNRSFTVTTVTPSAGFTVEYGVSTRSDTWPTSWQQGTTFTGLRDVTYYVWARTRETVNHNPGTPHQVGRIPNTNWTIRVGGNFANQTNGLLTFSAIYQDVNNSQMAQTLHTTSSSPGGNWHNWHVSANFAPWVLSSIMLEWNASANGRLRVANVQIEITGYNINIHRDFGDFDVTSSNSNRYFYRIYTMVW
jgi:hypothetical protein